MKTRSKRTAKTTGIIYGGCIFAVYLLVTVLLYYVLDGNTFITKDETVSEVCGVSFRTVNVVVILIAALLPMGFLRNQNSRFCAETAVIALLLYAVCLVVGFVILSNLAHLPGNPFNTFDAVYYGFISFPIGSIIGVLGRIGINLIRNRNKEEYR